MRASHKTILLASLIATVVAVPALAQQSASLTQYAACTGKPTAQDSDAAHSAFLLGRRFFDEADYGSAIHNFVDAYKLDCTKTDLLVIIARANELSGNRPEAVHTLEVYLQRASNVSSAEQAQIQKRIENLKAQIAAQTSTATPAATPTVAPTATATAAPAAPSLAATAPQSVPEIHHGIAPWVVVGLGGAAVITGTVLLIVGAGKVSDAQSHCPSSACPPGVSSAQALTFQDEDHLGRRLEGTGAIVGGVGVLTIVGGLIWHLSEGPSTVAAKALLTPSVSRGYAGMSLGGKF